MQSRRMTSERRGGSSLALRGLLAVLVLGVAGGCSSTSGLTEILENLNQTLTSIAVLKKGGQK